MEKFRTKTVSKIAPSIVELKAVGDSQLDRRIWGRGASERKHFFLKAAGDSVHILCRYFRHAAIPALRPQVRLFLEHGILTRAPSLFGAQSLVMRAPP